MAMNHDDEPASTNVRLGTGVSGETQFGKHVVCFTCIYQEEFPEFSEIPQNSRDFPFQKSLSRSVWQPA